MGSITVVKETGDLELTGGALCLDFANTLGDRPRSSNEHLGDYGDLIRFRRQAGVLSAADLDEIERMAEEHPRSARAALKRATDLRENLYTGSSVASPGGRHPRPRKSSP